MKYAVIDIGSNSMRLTLYEIEGNAFKILFREKSMAGLAGYVEGGVLSAEGIERAGEGLLGFRQTLESLGIENTAVFATASLRNIENTTEAVRAIQSATGYSIDVIGSDEEAVFGYLGAMRELSMDDGAFIDVGGASTEVVSFENGRLLTSASFRVGSLSLYRACVKKILPGDDSLRRIRDKIEENIDEKALDSFGRRSPLICVGGTARAVLKLARKLYGLPPDCRTISKAQFEDMASTLCRKRGVTAELVLKLAPDRIHTIVPGVMIMQHIFRLFAAQELVVSKYGVREGYLCQKVLKTDKTDTHIPKTGK